MDSGEAGVDDNRDDKLNKDSQMAQDFNGQLRGWTRGNTTNVKVSVR